MRHSTGLVDPSIRRQPTRLSGTKLLEIAGRCCLQARWRWRRDFLRRRGVAFRSLRLDLGIKKVKQRDHAEEEYKNDRCRNDSDNDHAFDIDVPCFNTLHV